MAAYKGRKFLLKKDGTVLAGIRTKSFAVNGEPIDITSDDDDGFRKLLEEAGQYQLDISFDGIVKDDTLRAIILAGGSLMLSDITMEMPDQDPAMELSGDFFLSDLEESGTYNEAVTFSGTLQSSGKWNYIAVTP
nr:hypothetical protein 27 [bacterium]